MEEYAVLDDHHVPVEPLENNKVLNVFCILGYIANGFWAIMLLTLSLLGVESLKRLVPDFKFYDEKLLKIIFFAFIFMFVLNVVSLVGLILAHKRKKAGAIIYGISNGLWALLMLLALQPLNIFVGLISVVFIIVIAKNYHK
jgi:hypothetical protein